MFKIVFTILSILFILSFDNNYAIAESVDELRERVNKLLLSKKFTEAEPILIELCDKRKHPRSCFVLAELYRKGKGVQKNIDFAYNLYQFVANNYVEQKPDEHILDQSKYWLATYTELVYATNNDILNISMNIWDELKDSKHNKIAEISKKALNRIPIYNFLDNFFKILYNVCHEKINGNQFESALNSLNSRVLPSNIRDTYNDYKLEAIEAEKWYSSKNEKGLQMLANSVIKPLTGDFSIFLDIGKAFFDFKAQDKRMEKVQTLFAKFLNELGEFGISKAWMDERLKNG